MRWDPFLKHPYTKLRDLGFGPEVQKMPVADANHMLAQITLAAINSNQEPTEVTDSIRTLLKKERRKGKAPTV